MGYEIDFLPVGNGERGGDAIALRYGNLHGARDEQTVVVVDGGFNESGEGVVAHIQDHYKTDRVDLVISTHPDDDHINGLFVVLDELQVDALAMHQPWDHTRDIANLFRDGRVTDASVSEHLRRSLESAKRLDATARNKGIPITEPFAGSHTGDDRLLVVGPTQEYYESLLPHFRGTPPPRAPSTIGGRVGRSLLDLVRTVEEGFGIETLDDEGVTSAENDSSAIVLLRIDGHSILLTGDAGMPALTNAADYMESIGFERTSLRFIQVPHHGSRRNVGPAVLDRLIGPRLPADEKVRTAFVSCPADGSPKHPAKKVTNAFRRRGAWVYATQGGAKRHHYDAPARDWGAATPLPIYDEVDE